MTDTESDHEQQHEQARSVPCLCPRCTRKRQQQQQGEDSDGISSYIVGMLLAIPLIAIHVAIDGAVLSRYWNWFASPAFNLPTVSNTMAMALACGLHFATRRMDLVWKNQQVERQGAYDFGKALIRDLVGKPTLYLLLAVALRWWMEGL